MLMDDRSILELIHAAHHLLEKLETTARDYGTGDLLYPADIHTVIALDQHEGSNLTQLAAALDVSPPAAFKFVKKLVSLGYLQKERLSGNDKEVALYLTEKGKLAVAAHRLFMQKVFGPLMAIEASLMTVQRDTIRKFLQDLERACSWG